MHSDFLLPLVPPPDSVFLSHDQSDGIYAGALLTVTCSITLLQAVDTPITAQIQWLPDSVLENDRITVSPVSQFFTTTLYTSSIAFDPVLFSDTANYTCVGYFEPDPLETSYITAGRTDSDIILILVEGKSTKA